MNSRDYSSISPSALSLLLMKSGSTIAFAKEADLTAIVELKSELVSKLHPRLLAGTLRVQALDALDSDAFAAAVNSMPQGPIAIANEGLLVYLDETEKARLAGNVRAALLARGGVWLTADVYVQNTGGSAPTVGYGRSREFIDKHRVEQNKFSSWQAAEQFFGKHGFAVRKKLAHEHPLHIRESWALAAVP